MQACSRAHEPVAEKYSPMFGRSTRWLAASVTLAIVGLTGEGKNGATCASRYNVKRFITTNSGRTKASAC